MKNVLMASAVLVMAMSAPVQAQAPVKIAVVRSADVIRESPLYKQAEAKMKAEFERRSKDIQETGRKLEEEIKKFQREADTLSTDARAKAEKDLNSRRIDLQTAERKFREDAANRDRELTQDLMGRVKEAIQQVAKEKGMDLIVQDALYVSPALDITNDVLKKLSQLPAAPVKK